jgi:hypothetical protein
MFSAHVKRAYQEPIGKKEERGKSDMRYKRPIRNETLKGQSEIRGKKGQPEMRNTVPIRNET